jgi:hypothetical protein
MPVLQRLLMDQPFVLVIPHIDLHTAPHLIMGTLLYLAGHLELLVADVLQ